MEEKRKNWTATKNGTKPTEWQVAVFRYVKQYTCFRKKWVFDSSREKSVKQRNDVEIKEQFTHYLLLLYICMCAMTRGRRRKDSLCHTYRTILRATWIILYIYSFWWVLSSGRSLCLSHAAIVSVNVCLIAILHSIIIVFMRFSVCTICVISNFCIYFATAMGSICAILAIHCSLCVYLHRYRAKILSAFGCIERECTR